MISRSLGVARTMLRTRRRSPVDPRFLTYIVTFTCNARCIMCDSWRKPSPDDLTLDEIERIFAQLPRLDIVRLSGGEPFARKDLGEIARLVETHLRPALLHVTSNGFLTDRIVRFCEERPHRTPLRMLISVDGIGAEHDRIRGSDTAWRRVMETVRALAPRQQELGLTLTVNQTIVDAKGAAQYRELRDVMAPLGVRTNVVIAYDASATYGLEEETIAHGQIGRFTTFGDLGDEVLRDLLDEVERDVKRWPFADRIAKSYWLRGARNRLLGKQNSPNPPCVALHSHLRMLPNGDVPVCQFNTTKVASLRHQSFAEVWGAKRTGDAREWVRKCPGCWAECEVVPSALYSGDLVLESLRRRRDRA